MRQNFKNIKEKKIIEIYARILNFRQIYVCVPAISVTQLITVFIEYLSPKRMWQLMTVGNGRVINNGANIELDPCLSQLVIISYIRSECNKKASLR